MTLKAFISTNDTAVCRNYLRVAQTALLNVNEFPISALMVDDANSADGYRQALAQNLIASADVFLGIYGTAYGTVVSGETHSIAEGEYQYARSLGLMCLLFVEEEARRNADERQQAFFHYIEQHHVLNLFKDAGELSAQIKLALRRYKHNMRLTNKLTPPNTQNLQPIIETSSDDELTVVTEDNPPDLPQLVEQAMALAEPSIEQIVRRALDLHDAQTQMRQQETEARLEELDGILEVKPIFGEPLRRSQYEMDIFMIMPFRERFDTIYSDVVQPVVTGLNLTIKRGDDFTSAQGAIMQDVWAAINAARLVIVETTEVNANVYYELGIAHTLGKPAILLTQRDNIDDVPFDIRHLRFTIYDDSIAGARKLTSNLRRSLIWLLNDLEERDMDDLGTS